MIILASLIIGGLIAFASLILALISNKFRKEFERKNTFEKAKLFLRDLKQ